MEARARQVLPVFLELLSWACLYWVEDAWAEALGFGLLHGAAALAVAWTRTGAAGQSARPGQARERLLLFAVCACLPFIGVPAVVLCLQLPSRPPAPRPAGYRVIDVPEALEYGPQEALEPLGSEPLAELRHGGSTERRIALLLETRRLGDACAVPLQRVALKDPADEVRLLAYGFLETRERALSARLQAGKEALASAAPERRGVLHLELAQCAWELVFLGLAQGDIATHVLQEARAHAEQAMRLLPRRGAACLLLARIHLRLGEVDAAARVLQEARSHGVAPEALAAHEAEVAFRRRRFSEVKRALASLGTTSGLRPRLDQLEVFWR